MNPFLTNVFLKALEDAKIGSVSSIKIRLGPVLLDLSPTYTINHSNQTPVAAVYTTRSSTDGFKPNPIDNLTQLFDHLFAMISEYISSGKYRDHDKPVVSIRHFNSDSVVCYEYITGVDKQIQLKEVSYYYHVNKLTIHGFKESQFSNC